MLTTVLAGTGSLILYAFSLALTGTGAAPLLFEIPATALGLAAVSSFRQPRRAGLGAVCLFVVATYPVTYASFDTFSNGFVAVHGDLWLAGWFGFLALTWYRYVARLSPVAWVLARIGER